ncbi:Endonuclease/exonuclease/phosphatase [Trinorchestia longiramus]|nr:Endonuclease/exonuclease/phosphatase [Trinorchestia longiramus]
MLWKKKCVIILLSSLPDRFFTLVTALEAHEKIPAWEVVTEHLLNEKRRQRGGPGTSDSSEKLLTINEVLLEQSAYTKALLSRFGMDKANSVATPVDVNADLVTTSDEVEDCDKDLYQSAVVIKELETKAAPRLTANEKLHNPHSGVHTALPERSTKLTTEDPNVQLNSARGILNTPAHTGSTASNKRGETTNNEENCQSTAEVLRSTVTWPAQDSNAKHHLAYTNGIHQSVNVEDIKASADCGSSELLSVARLPQYSGGIKEESSAVKLGFAGTQCPSHIYVGFTRYAVFPFNAPPRRCYRCQRLGHVAVNYNSPLRCLVCSGPHTKDECTAEPGQEKCANCHQTHIASSKECPAIRNAASIQKLQRSGVGFEVAKHKVMKTQTELVTKAQLMKKQNLTVPIVSSNTMGSQHRIQGNQQENPNDLTVQEVMVDIHQSGGSYLWSDAEVLPSTASSSPLYSSVVQGLNDLPSTSKHFQLSGVQERTPSNNITQPTKKPSPQMTTATECAEILSKSVESLGKKLEHQLKEMGREMESRVIQRLSLELQNKMELVIAEVSHIILSKVSSLLSELILANMQKEQPPQCQLLLVGMIRNHFGTEYSEPIITRCRNQGDKSPSKNMAESQCKDSALEARLSQATPVRTQRKQNEAREMAVIQFNCNGVSSKLSEIKLHIYATKPEVVCLCETWLMDTAPKPNFVGYVATWCPRVGGVREGGLAILVRHDIPFHLLRLEPFDGSLELQGVTLNTASGLIDIINVYNPNQPVLTGQDI